MQHHLLDAAADTDLLLSPCSPKLCAGPKCSEGHWLQSSSQAIKTKLGREDVDEQEDLSAARDQCCLSPVSSFEQREEAAAEPLTSLEACLRAQLRYARRLSFHGGHDCPLYAMLEETELRDLASKLNVIAPRDFMSPPKSS